jgi:putative membrane protein
MNAMKLYALVAATLVASGPVYAQSLGEQTGVNSALGIAPKTQDFVSEAAQGDMFEIASSEAAVQKGSDKVKSFANQMVDDHKKTSADLKRLTPAAGANLPSEMTASQKRDFEKLSGLQGQDFDKQYMDDQLSAHKAAVSLFERYGKSGDNAELQSWAKQTLPTLQQHLNMAQTLDKQARE